ncbi:heme-binding protein [Pedobacter lithocola]|uniref:Heme-binding protein n=1 Tax=Pedobacter lithocola TaxID=1908239 RepID=A0ABV8P7L3_9SPHI
MKSIIHLALLCFLANTSLAQTNYPKKSDTQSSRSFLIQKEVITLEAAIHLANSARKKASLLGKDVSVAVVDANGQIIILSRGDGVGIHNTEAARRKAFTAASTKTATLILSRNTRVNPDTENLANLPELLLLGGGIPLFHQGKIIGAIGIAGGGSPEHDDLIGRSVSMLDADIIAK